MFLLFSHAPATSPANRVSKGNDKLTLYGLPFQAQPELNDARLVIMNARVPESRRLIRIHIVQMIQEVEKVSREPRL
jgi:hypothetical protein